MGALLFYAPFSALPLSISHYSDPLTYTKLNAMDFVIFEHNLVKYGCAPFCAPFYALPLSTLLIAILYNTEKLWISNI